MKRCALSCALAASIMVISNAKAANEFDRFYVGIDSGFNKSTATKLPDQNHNYQGGVAGLNWDFQGYYLVGLDLFFDNHRSAYTKRDWGADVKLGFPMKSWLPYAKMGLVVPHSGTSLKGKAGNLEYRFSEQLRFRTGLGIEYKLSDRWSVNGEWTRDKLMTGTRNYINNNYVIGLNHYFGESSSAAEGREAAAREAAAKKAATGKFVR